MGNYKNNTTKHRYELEENGFTAFADYKLDGSTLYIKYVEAPLQLRGQGTAGRLMKHVADEAKAKSYKIVPICGYAASWLRRHGEYYELIDR